MDKKTEEREFFDAYKAGKVGNEELYQRYSKLIYHYLHRRHIPMQDLADVHQDAILALFDAAKTFNPRIAMFSTYFIANGLRTVVQNYRRKSKQMNSLDQMMEEKHFDIEYNEKELITFESNLRVAVSTLTTFEKKLIIAHYFQERTYTEMEKLFSQPRGSLHFALKRALVKLKLVLTSGSVLKGID